MPNATEFRVRNDLEADLAPDLEHPEPTPDPAKRLEEFQEKLAEFYRDENAWTTREVNNGPWPVEHLSKFQPETLALKGIDLANTLQFVNLEERREFAAVAAPALTGRMLNMIGETWNGEPATGEAAATAEKATADPALAEISQGLTDLLAHQLERWQPERKWQLRGDLQLILQLAQERIAAPHTGTADFRPCDEQLASHRAYWLPEANPDKAAAFGPERYQNNLLALAEHHQQAVSALHAGLQQMFPGQAYHNESYSPEGSEISISTAANYYLDLKMVFDNQDFASAEDYRKQANALALAVIPDDPGLYEWSREADRAGFNAREELTRMLLDPNPDNLHWRSNRLASNFIVWQDGVNAVKELLAELNGNP